MESSYNGGTVPTRYLTPPSRSSHIRNRAHRVVLFLWALCFILFFSSPSFCLIGFFFLNLFSFSLFRVFYPPYLFVLRKVGEELEVWVSLEVERNKLGERKTWTKYVVQKKLIRKTSQHKRHLLANPECGMTSTRHIPSFTPAREALC